MTERPPDDVPVPRRTAPFSATIAQLAGAAVVMWGAVALTWFVSEWTGSWFAGVAAGAAIVAPPVVWALRRGSRAVFHGLGAAALACLCAAFAVVFGPALLRRPARPPVAVARPAGSVAVPATSTIVVSRSDDGCRTVILKDGARLEVPRHGRIVVSSDGPVRIAFDSQASPQAPPAPAPDDAEPK